jgi:hypothetical protein
MCLDLHFKTTKSKVGKKDEGRTNRLLLSLRCVSTSLLPQLVLPLFSFVVDDGFPGTVPLCCSFDLSLCLIQCWNWIRMCDLALESSDSNLL